jgi:hypothetical protein
MPHVSRLDKNILQIPMARQGDPRLQGGFASHIGHEHDAEDGLERVRAVWRKPRYPCAAWAPGMGYVLNVHLFN